MPSQLWFCLDSPLIYRCWACFFAESSQLRYIPVQDPCDHWLAYLARRCRRPLIIMENRGCPVTSDCLARWEKPLHRYFPQADWLPAEAMAAGRQSKPTVNPEVVPGGAGLRMHLLGLRD